MKNINLSLSAALLIFASSVAQAEPVGRVLIAVGDTTALRNGSVVKLTRGTEVHSGDTLRVGDASNMQVRFTDASITALRSNSVFRIDDYKFEEKTNLGKSFFSLVKGGMRTITGLIGRFNRENYAVRAQTATIGIRGTHFVLAQCSNDCFNKDGSQAENGLFGGVTDGRIAVNNEAGEREFGKNEFFHVASTDALPQPLLVPPAFLRDQLEGQAKSQKGKATLAKAAESPTEPESGVEKGETAESEAAGGKEGSAAEGGETASTVTEQQTNTAVTTQPADGTTVVAQVAGTQFVPAEQTAVQTNVSGGLITTGGQAYPYRIAMVNAWTGISVKPYRDPTTGNIYAGTSWGFGYSDAGIEQGVLTIVDLAQFKQNDKMMFADIVVNQGTPLTFFANAFTRSGTWNYFDYSGTPSCFNNCTGTLVGTASFTWSKSASTNMGTNAAAGNLSWGRYTMTTSGTVQTGVYAGHNYSETNYEHWATGDPVTALPTSGTYTYNHVGGTTPTDQNGNTGTFAGGSTVGVAFNQTGAAVTVLGASWTMNGAGASGNTYALNIATPVQVNISQTPYNFSSAGGSDVGTRTSIGPITVSAGCAGGSCPASGVTATISPMFFGANAQGLATGISTRPSPVGNVEQTGERTSSVQVYMR